MNDPKPSSGASAHGYHRIESYLLCPKRYQYQEVRGLHIPTDFTPGYFAQGLLFHALRARWFARKFDTSKETWDSCLQAAQAEISAQPKPVNPEDERFALDMFQQYVDHWSKETLPEPVGAEYALGPIKLRESDPDECVFTARLDDVSVYPDEARGLAIGEAKTTSDTASCAAEYQMHGQPLLQIALWNAAEQGGKKHGPVEGVVLDMIRKPRKKADGSVGKAGFTRQFMPINQRVLGWYIPNLVNQKIQALFVRSDDEVSRNVTSCSRVYGRMRVPCPYQQLCAHGRNAGGEFYLKNGTRMWDWRPSYPGEVPPWD